MSVVWGYQEQIPEYYADFIRISANLYSFILELGVQGVPDTPASEHPQAKMLARVRISPQHALILMKLLQKNLAAYRAAVGPIAIPDQVYRDLDIPKEED